jgi:hypothetical protein
MPLEGHWQRVNTPVRKLTRRELRLVRAALVAVVAATIAIVVVAVVAVSSSTPAPRPGCISAIIPGAMGGVPVDARGARARAICASHAGQSDPGSLSIERDCRRAGIAA